MLATRGLRLFEIKNTKYKPSLSPSSLSLPFHPFSKPTALYSTSLPLPRFQQLHRPSALFPHTQSDLSPLHNWLRRQYTNDAKTEPEKTTPAGMYVPITRIGIGPKPAEEQATPPNLRKTKVIHITDRLLLVLLLLLFICALVYTICEKYGVKMPEMPQMPQIEMPKVEMPKVEMPKMEISRYQLPEVSFALPTIKLPVEKWAHLALALIYRQLGDDSSALDHLQLALAALPNPYAILDKEVRDPTVPEVNTMKQFFLRLRSGEVTYDMIAEKIIQYRDQHGIVDHFDLEDVEDDSTDYNEEEDDDNDDNDDDEGEEFRNLHLEEFGGNLKEFKRKLAAKALLSNEMKGEVKFVDKQVRNERIRKHVRKAIQRIENLRDLDEHLHKNLEKYLQDPHMKRMYHHLHTDEDTYPFLDCKEARIKDFERLLDILKNKNIQSPKEIVEEFARTDETGDETADAFRDSLRLESIFEMPPVEVERYDTLLEQIQEAFRGREELNYALLRTLQDDLSPYSDIIPIPQPPPPRDPLTVQAIRTLLTQKHVLPEENNDIVPPPLAPAMGLQEMLRDREKLEEQMQMEILPLRKGELPKRPMVDGDGVLILPDAHANERRFYYKLIIDTQQRVGGDEEALKAVDQLIEEDSNCLELYTRKLDLLTRLGRGENEMYPVKYHMWRLDRSEESLLDAVRYYHYYSRAQGSEAFRRYVMEYPSAENLIDMGDMYLINLENVGEADRCYMESLILRPSFEAFVKLRLTRTEMIGKDHVEVALDGLNQYFLYLEHFLQTPEGKRIPFALHRYLAFDRLCFAFSFQQKTDRQLLEMVHACRQRLLTHFADMPPDQLKEELYETPLFDFIEEVIANNEEIELGLHMYRTLAQTSPLSFYSLAPLGFSSRTNYLHYLDDLDDSTFYQSQDVMRHFDTLLPLQFLVLEKE